MQQFVEDIGLSIFWGALGVVLLFVATLIFDRLDPLDIRGMIKEGNIAAGILLGALAVGMAIIIAQAIS